MPTQLITKLQNKIHDETGYEVDLSPVYIEYQRYFDLNRPMKSFELKGGPIQIGGGCINKTFGECINLASQRFEDKMCNRDRYSAAECRPGARNMVIMLFTMNRLVSAKSLPRKQRDREINLGLFVASLNKYDKKARAPYGAWYDRFIEMVEASVSDLSSSDTRLLSPTAEYVLSLSESEKMAYLVGAVALGTTALVKYSQYACRNGGCSGGSSVSPSSSNPNSRKYTCKVACTTSSIIAGAGFGDKRNIHRFSFKVNAGSIGEAEKYGASRKKEVCKQAGMFSIVGGGASCSSY